MLTSLVSAVFQTQAVTHLLIVGGIGGEPLYTNLFHARATGLMDAAVERYNLSIENVHYLAERTDLAPGLIEARSTKEAFEDVVADVAASAGVNDHVVIVLFGHGSERDGIPKFNLPGPDITAPEFAVLLGLLAPRTVTVVNTSSSSGGFIGHLSGPNRIIMTATRSGGERNEARFAEFFVRAFDGGDADVDKDNRVSMLEAFSYARLEVERAYQQDNLIQSEHALLDDNGDGEGSLEPDPLQNDGALARRVFLTGSATVLAGSSDDPELVALYQEKEQLETAIQSLRGEKDSLPEEEFENRLEDLIVELSLATRAIRQRESNEN